MPFYGRRSFRRTRHFRRRFRPRFRRLRRFIKRTVTRMAETKVAFKANNVANLRINNPMVISFVDGISTGVGSFNRVANKIALRRVGFRLQVRFIPGSIPDALLRVALLFPRKTIANDKLNGIQGTFIYNAYDPDLVFVAYDKVFGMGAQTGTNPDLPAKRLIKYSKSVRQMVIRYPSETDDDVEREPLLIISTDIPMADLSSLEIFCQTRTSYIDV